MFFKYNICVDLRYYAEQEEKKYGMIGIEICII